jgi:hypothetical protein
LELIHDCRNLGIDVLFGALRRLFVVEAICIGTEGANLWLFERIVRILSRVATIMANGAVRNLLSRARIQ